MATALVNDRTQQQAEVSIRFGRWMVLLSVVFLLHVIPLLFLSLPPPPIIEEPETTMAVQLDDLLELLKPPDMPMVSTPEKMIVMPSIKVPPETEVKVKVDEVKPPAPPVAKTPPVTKAAPVPPAAPPPPTEKKYEPEPERKYEPVYLDPLKPNTGYDLSKETKEVPPEAESLRSDRTSTAADRGPKDLPTGETYIEKGQSPDIRAMGNRGEGYLPPVDSDANSGSVKKSGTPDAGKGPQDKDRSPDKKMPIAPPALKSPIDEKNTGDLTDAKKPSGKENTREVLPEKPEPALLKDIDTPPSKIAEIKKSEIGEAASDSPAKKLTPEPAAPPKTAKVLDSKIDKKKPATSTASPNDAKPTVAEQKVSGTNEPAATAPKMKEPVDELASLKALLDSTGNSDGRGGNKGEKPGINARKGKMGHEGDGTLRPGDDGAYSDVTTINLNSSAKNVGDASFAKRTDEKAKYFKPLFTRIDGKWKAEIAARSRFRFEQGWVVMKIVVSREGKLLSATEVSRTPKDFSDEYVSIAKVAVQRAADPDTEPFPETLQKFEKLECEIGFGY